ncbi:squalene monooxygenase [Trichoderma gamsii]|uniref:Squalene monooxygenase n=1 Tax=Trichoderma gamsii TaxID=398673 RepID=A0A2P4ZB23_9HYPO|nr:squalene monooxygenase [Trichoderma gamsii]PON21494.1 squalene monooxygenase [Trichoderma gamsii]
MSETMTSSHIYTRERRDRYHEADVVVVGAGIFGCAAAYALADQGRSVLLLERWMHEPDRIVGELLQPGGLAALKKLGLGHCVEGIDAIPCYGYNVIYHGEPCEIPYPRLNEQGEVTHAWSGRGTEGEKQQGCGFHHGKFISQLRKACLGHKNITVVETEVVKTIRGEFEDQILGVESRTTALYSLFAANDRQLRALQMGCFEYFRRGWTDGPAGLLGGIIQRPLVLAYHFFYVAFVAIWMNACNVIGGPLGFWKLPLAILDAVLILWKACIVFLPVIWREGFQ